jgi:hypothetical protein
MYVKMLDKKNLVLTKWQLLDNELSNKEAVSVHNKYF